MTGPAQPSVLETRYRRLLRLWPKPYRQVREQQMVDAFLESAAEADPENADITAKYGSVGWPASRAVFALAVKLRWAEPTGPERYRVRLPALHIAVLAVLTISAAQSVIVLLGRLRSQLRPPKGFDIPSATPIVDDSLLQQFSRLLSEWGWCASALLIPALALALLGSRQALLWATAFSAAPAVVTVVTAALYPFSGFSWWTSAVVELAVPLGLAALAISNATDRRSSCFRRMRRWLIAAGLVIVALDSVLVLVFGLLTSWWTDPLAWSGTDLPAWQQTLGWIFFDTLVWWLVAAFVAAVIVLVRAQRHHPVSIATLLGLSGFSGAGTLMQLGILIDRYPEAFSSYSPTPAAFGISMAIQLLLVAAVTIGTGVAAYARIRRLPPIRYSQTAPSDTD